MQDSTGAGPAKLIFRFALLIAFILAATWGAHLIKEALGLEIRPGNEQQVHRLIMGGAVAYIGLLAIPFVPGAEIGIAMLSAFGARIAPLIYVCTIASMMLAFTIGRYLPADRLESVLTTLRMRRAATLVAQLSALPREERLTFMMGDRPNGVRRLGLRYRYVGLALAVNVPGNSLIGGGGGIMMIAGLSGIFSPVATFLTVAIAVSPVPLAVMFFGLEF